MGVVSGQASILPCRSRAGPGRPAGCPGRENGVSGGVRSGGSLSKAGQATVTRGFPLPPRPLPPGGEGISGFYAFFD